MGLSMQIAAIFALIGFSSAQTIQNVSPPIILGEGPHWDVTNEKLYFVDIHGQKIMRLDPTTGNLTYAYLAQGRVGAVVPVQGTSDKFVVAVGTDVVIVTWNAWANSDSPAIQKLTTLEDSPDDTRVNDGKCDPAGRLWIGTMALEVNTYIAPGKGSLYTVDRYSTMRVISPVSISNGLAWNSAKNTMYYIDSPAKVIWAFDYDFRNGSIANRRTIFDLVKNGVGEGVPDGMTIDTNDNLWIAVNYGGVVLQVDPRTGKLLRSIVMPTKRITSVAFGGPTLDVLYVTSMNAGMTNLEKEADPNAGVVFAVKGLGVKGVPPYEFKYNFEPIKK